MTADIPGYLRDRRGIRTVDMSGDLLRRLTMPGDVISIAPAFCCLMVLYPVYMLVADISRLNVPPPSPARINVSFGASPEAEDAQRGNRPGDGRGTHIIGRGVGGEEGHEEGAEGIVEAPDKGGFLGCVHGVSCNPIEFDGFAVGSGSPSLAAPRTGRRGDTRE